MNNRKAFTYIELMISVVVIGVISSTALEFLKYCSSFIEISNTRVAAANFARETMEGLYMNDYSDSSLTAGSYTEVTTPSLALPAAPDFGSRLHDRHEGTRKYDVVNKTDYKTITVTVDWNR